MTPTRQRILQRTPASIQFQPVDSYGENTTVDPGLVTVTVARSDGTVLYTAAATGGAGTSARTYALTAVDTALLDVLTATWQVGGVTIGVTSHDIVGAYYFTIAELRRVEPDLSNETTYPTATLIAHRDEVETSFESWTQMAWVPRFTVVDQYPTYGHCLLTDLYALRSVRWARTWSTDGTATEVDSVTVAAWPGSYIGEIPYRFGSRVTLGAEHGQERPPADLKRVAMRYCRRLAQRATSGLSDRAQSYTTPEGQLVNLGRIGTDWRPTGDEYIDEVLRRPDIDHRTVGIG